MKDINMEKQKNKRLTVRLDWDLYLKLKVLAAQLDISMNAIVVAAIENHLENKE